jgi:inhibitor of cysteine peptidase
MTQVDDSFDGRQITLHPGETLEVRLSENPSTGYRWKEAEQSQAGSMNVLRKVDDAFESPPGQRVPGRPGTRILRFEATTSGGADLVLQYGRSWNSGAQPARTFRLRVRVQPGG